MVSSFESPDETKSQKEVLDVEVEDSLMPVLGYIVILFVAEAI
jgi:hypothetical protein